MRVLVLLLVAALGFPALFDGADADDLFDRVEHHISSDYTLVTIPSSGHWVQRDAAELVTETMKWWLLARR